MEKKKMIKELFHTVKFSSVIKNKFGFNILKKAIKSLVVEDKKELKEYFEKKTSQLGKQETSKLQSLLKFL